MEGGRSVCGVEEKKNKNKNTQVNVLRKTEGGGRQQQDCYGITFKLLPESKEAAQHRGHILESLPGIPGVDHLRGIRVLEIQLNLSNNLCVCVCVCVCGMTEVLARKHKQQKQKKNTKERERETVPLVWPGSEQESSCLPAILAHEAQSAVPL